jgi:iron complex outermembrane recepter protein
LLGKNASLGAISILSRQPGDRASFDGRAGYEAVNGGYALDAAGDAPLSDRVALRLAAHYNDLDGWVHTASPTTTALNTRTWACGRSCAPMSPTP